MSRFLEKGTARLVAIPPHIWLENDESCVEDPGLTLPLRTHTLESNAFLVAESDMDGRIFSDTDQGVTIQVGLRPMVLLLPSGEQDPTTTSEIQTGVDSCIIFAVQGREEVCEVEPLYETFSSRLTTKITELKDEAPQQIDSRAELLGINVPRSDARRFRVEVKGSPDKDDEWWGMSVVKADVHVLYEPGSHKSWPILMCPRSSETVVSVTTFRDPLCED